MQQKKGKKADRRQSKKKPEKKNRFRAEQLMNEKAIKYLTEDSLKVVMIKGKKQVVQTDKYFIDSVTAICLATGNLFKDIIKAKHHELTDQECEQIHYRAKLHRRANMININGHLTKKEIHEKEALKTLYCYCGCERFKGKSFPICQQMQQLSFLGSGLLLFFLLVKGLVLSTTFMLLIYGFFAIITYGQGTITNTESPGLCLTSPSFCQVKNKYSSFNADNPSQTLIILEWLGLGVMILWIFIMRIVKEYGFYQNTIIDMNLKSSSDYAIKIDNLPQGEYNEEELFQFLQQLYQRRINNERPQDLVDDILKAHHKDHNQQQSNIAMAMISMPHGGDSKLTQEIVKKKIMSQIQSKIEDVLGQDDSENHFHIKSIQIIYKMQFCRKIIQKIITGCQLIKETYEVENGQVLILERDKYQTMKKDIIQTYETLQDLRKKFLSDSDFRQKIATRTAIIQFANQSDMQLVVTKFGHQSLTFYKKLKETLAELTTGSSMVMFKGRIPNITRAPEPSDILWTNCEKSFSFMRIFGIFFAVCVVITISLGIIAGLQAIQFALRQSSATGQASPLVSLFNILTSIVLVVVNAVIWILLKSLLDYEYNHTQTTKITSLMKYSFLATWVNIIVIPLVVNYAIYDNYYGSQGVAGIIFDYQMIALAVSLPLILFNPVQMLSVVAIKITPIRNYFIRLFYRKKDEDQNQRFRIKQDRMKKIYSFYQAPQFVIEEAYTFILPNIMHALFFCQLQPLLLVFACAQTFLFYWVCKIKVLKMCKIPVMTQRLIFEVAIYQAMLAPIFYAVGGIVNSYLSSVVPRRASEKDPHIAFHYIGSVICLVIMALNYFNPRNIFQKVFVGISQCFPCLRKEEVYREMVEQQKKQSLVNQKKARIETYYRNSNCLSLLGFEKELFKQINSRQIQGQLRSFCESHVGSKDDGHKYEIDSEVSEKSRHDNFLQMDIRPMIDGYIFD